MAVACTQCGASFEPRAGERLLQCTYCDTALVVDGSATLYHEMMVPTVASEKVSATIFETAWALRGYDRLMMDFFDDPDLADRILEFPYQYHLTAAKRLTEMGVDMIWLGDDVGGQFGPPTNDGGNDRSTNQ